MWGQIGDRLNRGSKLFRVSDLTDMQATIKISQSDADLVQLKQKVKINTGLNDWQGEVSLIEPMVRDGLITVLVNFPQTNNSILSPDLDVEASITIKQLENVLYVKKPIDVYPLTVSSIFKFTVDNHHVNKIDVSFGESSGDFIMIKNGLNVNDQVIASSMTEYMEHQTLSIRK